MLDEDIRSAIADALARNRPRPSRTVDIIKSRVNGTTDAQLFAAAIVVLREQAKRIAELRPKPTNSPTTLAVSKMTSPS